MEIDATGNKTAECTVDTATTGIGSNDYGNEIGVQCCSIDGTDGYRQDLIGGIDYDGYKGCLKGVTYDIANNACENSGGRLCTADEVRNHIGKGTGCNHDDRHVWTSTVCTGINHWIVVGKQEYETDSSGNKPPECTEDVFTIGIGSNDNGNKIGAQCCSLDGTEGYRQNLIGGEDYGEYTGCLNGVTYDVAKAACEQSGGRLCTVDEVKNDIGAGTGCNHNARHVWTADLCGGTGKASREIEFSSEKRCSNLDERIDIQYEGTMNECATFCRSLGEDCIMINYYTYFKSVNDSRCYIFDRVCIVESDKNEKKSYIGYKTHEQECIDYPADWRDNVGDSCIYYESFNLCINGNYTNNEDEELMDLMDTKYALTAIEACCDCGGGVYIVDDVQLSYDDNWVHIDGEADILCKSNLSNITSKQLRNWDNMMLFSLCNNLKGINCSYLINTNFQSNSYSYSLFVCNGVNGSSKLNSFIFEVIINDIDGTHDTYINPLWFQLNLSYYSSFININNDVNPLQCIPDTTYIHNINATLYGVHPCHILNKSVVVNNNGSNEKHDDNMVVILITVFIIILVVLIVIIILIIYYRKKRYDEHDINGNEGNQQIELQKQINNESTFNGNSNYCIVCCDNVANLFNDPCGHVTYCNNCIHKIRSKTCPNCRKNVQFKQLYNGGFSAN